MSEPSSTRPRPSLLERLSTRLLRAPEDREQLLHLMRRLRERELLDAEAMSMIEGVLQVSELSAGDIMVPRNRMDVVDVAQPTADLVAFAIRTAHSRFPVIEGERDNVIGVLHAKDLLHLYARPGTTVRSVLRAPTFIPESKRLNVLLRDFRENRQHLAIVVDEYGRVAGLITIEDVLEQIVGDIADEFDLDETAANIVEIDTASGRQRWRVSAGTGLEQFNEAFAADLVDDAADTLGGWIAARLGRVPRRGDRIELDGLRIEVVRADPRTVHLLRVERRSGPPADAP
jgi:magnesium and cobalt transporter